jgi:diguanylate cyclase (GGDEF)-like protein/PAS domain S-box-containing protein
MIDDPLSILMLEDDAVDQQFLERELRKHIRQLALTWATGRQDYELALRSFPFDLILADYNLPGYHGLAALELAQRIAPRTPFIVVTGSLDEETAADIIKAGAADYVLKERIGRLGPAIGSARERQRMENEKETAVLALRESEERYALAVCGANDGLFDWDLRCNRIHFSPRWKEMLGHGAGEIGAAPEEWLGRIHPEEVGEFRQRLEAHLKGQEAHFELEYRIRHRDGTYRWMLSRGLAVRDGQGEAYRMAGSLTDVTRRKEAEERLLHDALHDGLTGLANRTLFGDRLHQALARSRRREDYSFAVLYVDIDQFKVINDSLGHLAGDEVLVALARRLEACLRPGDTVARLGGDEFAVLVEDVDDVSQALRIADRVHEELSPPLRVRGHDVFATASVGIARAATRYEQAHELLRDADIAMYRAKRRGRGSSEIFDTSMHVIATTRLRMETELRRALERQELRIHYQPLVSLETRRITGMEALVRWQHPERGLLLPKEFIPLAEEIGAIVPLGRWVLKNACADARRWREQTSGGPPVAVSVNLSARQFSQSDVYALTCEALDESGLPAPSLRLELTESALMDDPVAAAARLGQLKQLGVNLDIDDFGTGYSSLSYLRRFPIDALKIDRAFVSKMDAEVEDREIVRTIVTLAANLGVSAVAEGVETPAQEAQLRGFHCPYAQGFLFSRPVPAAEAAGLLRGRTLQP